MKLGLACWICRLPSRLLNKRDSAAGWSLSTLLPRCNVDGKTWDAKKKRAFSIKQICSIFVARKLAIFVGAMPLQNYSKYEKVIKLLLHFLFYWTVYSTFTLLLLLILLRSSSPMIRCTKTLAVKKKDVQMLERRRRSSSVISSTWDGLPLGHEMYSTSNEAKMTPLKRYSVYQMTSPL